jgi:cobalt-zinc-cadmium efflux system membrane fusion protein
MSSAHQQPSEADSGHDAGGEPGAEDHAGHQPPGQDAVTSLELSQQGRKNIGLTLATVALSDFQRTVSVPAALVVRPGRTEITVSAPMTGLVTRIYPIQGEAVAPGDPLFDLRLTHEDLVEKQSALLRQVEELDVIEREVARLKTVTASGAVPGKRLLERQYEQQKVEADIRAERQALLLHGLTEAQIQGIVDQRRLLQELTILAPPITDCESCRAHDEFLQVGRLTIRLGEHVTAGTPLATLTDHCELYVEAKAFEHDADALNEAANEGVEVTALVEGNGSGRHEVSGLRILYVENEVERESRALKFYLRLPNELIRNEVTPDGHRFVGWRYRPGQRVEVLVPVERWEGRIVLPVEAVVQEGAETYVYQQMAGRFERKPVHVEYRDQRFAVVESDGTLFPGDAVAASGAYQIHLALKNQAGGGADPHAGHHH